MLLIEVSEIMSVRDWVDFKEFLAHNKVPQKFIDFPDGRKMEWFDDEIVHDFMTGPVIEGQAEPEVHGFKEPPSGPSPKA